MSALGLHLKSNGFSAVEISLDKKEKALKKSGDYEIPNFSLNLDDPKSLETYTNALKEFIFENNFESKDVIGSLPQDQVFVRTIKVPQMSKKDLDSFIKYESAQYIPLPLEEITLGYDVMSLNLKERDKISVLLVAAKKTVVQKYIEVIKNAGLKVRALEPVSLAMVRSLGEGGQAHSAELIIEIGATQTLIVLSYKGFVILTRSVPLGEESFTRSLSQKMDLDLVQAQEYFKTYGLDSTKVGGKVYEVLRPLFDKVIDEIKKSKVFFSTHNPMVRINKIIVSGETALMPGLLIYMVNNFDVEVVLANPWINLKLLPSQQKEVQQKGPVFSVAVGLALKAFLIYEIRYKFINKRRKSRTNSGEGREGEFCFGSNPSTSGWWI